MKALYVRPASGPLPDVRLFADSAIGRDVMPLFIPDILDGWEADICLAFRVSRLGKNIPEKFAHRYIDAAGTVALLRQSLHPDFEHSGAATIMDSMVTTGSWMPMEKLMPPDLKLKVCAQGVDTEAAHSIDSLGLARCISQVSTVATIKSGDILIMADAAVRVPLQTNTYIDAWIDGDRTLHLKVK